MNELTVNREAQINSELDRLDSKAKRNATAFVLTCIERGRLLSEVKAALPHGQFTAWIETHRPYTPKQARTYMRAWERSREPGFALDGESTLSSIAYTPAENVPEVRSPLDPDDINYERWLELDRCYKKWWDSAVESVVILIKAREDAPDIINRWSVEGPGTEPLSAFSDRRLSAGVFENFLGQVFDNTTKYEKFHAEVLLRVRAVT